MNDFEPSEFRVLISREEIQSRFGIVPKKMSDWLKDASCGIPVIYVTSVPQFEVGAFMRWLIKFCGRGDWGMEAGGKVPEPRRGARVVPVRGRREPLPSK